MRPNHQIEHDHDKISALLAQRAAGDTSWDQPPMLFALLHDPDAGYGIAPVRPLNDYLHQYIQQGPLHVVLWNIARNVQAIEEGLPGLDVLRNTVLVCQEDREFRRTWFPPVSARTLSCGLVLRTEEWKIPNDVPRPQGSFADAPGAIESCSWKAVVDDDTFNWVWWDRGEEAPGGNTWSFDSDFYRSTKDQQRVPRLMRKIVALSARVSHLPLPDLPDTPPGP